jgi:hypothetical protein
VIIEAAIPGEYNTKSIAVTDVNGDGFIDIIVGNSELFPISQTPHHVIDCRVELSLLPGTVELKR